MDSRLLVRKTKKAAKREKRSRKIKPRRSAVRRDVREASDVEWGSDGPPDGILDVEGVEGDEEDDMAILRDYLAGTLLGKGADSDLEEGEADEAVAKDEVAMFAGGRRDVGSAAVDDEAMAADDSAGEVIGDDEDSDSDLDDLQGALEGLDEEEDGDASDDSDDGRFAGKQEWEDDNDWFIRNMEVCHNRPSCGLTARAHWMEDSVHKARKRARRCSKPSRTAISVTIGRRVCLLYLST